MERSPVPATSQPPTCAAADAGVCRRVAAAAKNLANESKGAGIERAFSAQAGVCTETFRIADGVLFFAIPPSTAA